MLVYAPFAPHMAHIKTQYKSHLPSNFSECWLRIATELLSKLFVGCVLTHGANQQNILTIQVVIKKWVSILTNIGYTPHVVIAPVSGYPLGINSLLYLNSQETIYFQQVICLEKFCVFFKKIFLEL